MGLCFDNEDKEIITGNVIIFRGRVCVGLFIYIQYQLLYKNPLFRSSVPLSCFADGSGTVAMHNRTEALAAVPSKSALQYYTPFCRGNSFA